MNIKKEILIKKQDIAVAIRRLISRYLSGKRGDTDISEIKKLYDYIQREDLWRTELINDGNFQEDLYNIFENLKKEINLVLECNRIDNICEDCNLNGGKKICKECNKCNCGLRIGHAFEFYELMEEEPFDLDKFKKNENNEISHINEKEFKNKLNKSRISEINGNNEINEINENNENSESIKERKSSIEEIPLIYVKHVIIEKHGIFILLSNNVKQVIFHDKVEILLLEEKGIIGHLSRKKELTVIPIHNVLRNPNHTFAKRMKYIRQMSFLNIKDKLKKKLDERRKKSNDEKDTDE